MFTGGALGTWLGNEGSDLINGSIRGWASETISPDKPFLLKLVFSGILSQMRPNAVIKFMFFVKQHGGSKWRCRTPTGFLCSCSSHPLSQTR
jgi:hypothetical protein